MPKVSPTYEFESSLLSSSSGFSYIIGFDEVGRGAIAGPVVVAACLITPENVSTELIVGGLMDSKLIPETKRPGVAEAVRSTYLSFGVGASSAPLVDSEGIVKGLSSAALTAFNLLLENSVLDASGASLTPDNTVLLLDGSHDWLSPVLPDWTVLTRVKGDKECVSMAAASIIAKVHRDNYMIELSSSPNYSVYRWDKNKGYGAKSHYEAISEYGISDEHRASWIKK